MTPINRSIRLSLGGFLDAAIRLASAAAIPTITGFAIDSGLAAPRVELLHQSYHFGRQQYHIASLQNRLQQQRRILLILNESDTESDDGISSSSSRDVSRSKRSIARAGGRKPKVNNPPPPNKTDKGVLSLLKQWAAPILFTVLLFKFLFSGLFPSSSNYVYYSRSVYQSTTYMRDGNVETKRKETFQSNIPGLVEKSKDGVGTKSIEDEIGEIEDELLDAFGIRGW